MMFARFVSTPAQLHPGEVLEKVVIKEGVWGGGGGREGAVKQRDEEGRGGGGETNGG